MYWCNSNASASAALKTRVSSYLSVAGEATLSEGGNIRIAKGWYRRPEGGNTTTTTAAAAVEEGGARGLQDAKIAA